ncbi:hydrogenase expression/formation protein HypE [Tautonia marina]|uniref:hydrogenase expression/formation protein HypE n=1 Tax=Tautonia marina TaxID=2653855 RepID=UPI001260E8FF|nr:hydrogenase expression/formation protein HypE [Tautonia marina]
MPEPPRFDEWTCPMPLRETPTVVMGHGGGGRLSGELLEHLFLPAFRNEALEARGDAALVAVPAGRLAFATDAHVVRPLVFPGGSIGELAVYGTVNDLAMVGARPLHLSASFILEEGLAMEQLAAIVGRMAEAARRAGVAIVTGDTKVVERGHGDGCYLTTSGIGVVPEGRSVGPDRARAGDAVIVSGTIGDHGVAILSVREGLAFESAIESDCAPLSELVERLFAASVEVRALRDPTRGGLAATLIEIAERSAVGVVLDEGAVPVRPEVRGACELLGLDPLMIANEGKLVAIVPDAQAEAALEALRSVAIGRQAVRIGSVVSEHPGTVVMTTAIGGRRVVTLPLGEQLPRIC